MSNLYLDFETYNETDISVGTHRYAETAEVLLATYALDDGPVLEWDRTEDIMPGDLYGWLLDDDIDITAHHAAFDRAILRLGLGIDTRLERWRCTMVKAYSHAYPGSLDAVGRLLGVPADKAKLASGKKLINRFCKPAPSNHKADRYDKTTHPEEWAEFKRYAGIDIEAMREVDKRLPNWNWKPSDIAMYHLDQRINDRGFKVDQELVKAGAEAAVAEKARMAKEFIRLTDGVVERPTLRVQFMRFLNETFDLDLDNTRAETFRDILGGDDELDADCRRLMELSILANKTSTAKYATLQPAVSSDGRFRGGLQFRGAARTRRWCLTGDHEVLTKDGWVRIEEWRGGVIAQWKAGDIRFAHADHVCFQYDGPMIHAARKNRISASMTPEHTLCAARGSISAGAAFGRTLQGVPRGGVWRNHMVSTLQTRILVMLQHDGYEGRSAVEWSFRKRRKYTRCLKLLASARIKYTTGQKTNGVLWVRVSRKTAPSWLVKRDFGPWLLQEGHSPVVFCDEIKYWDGGNRRDKQIEVCAKKRVNAEWTVTMAHLAGFAGTLTQRSNGYWFANITTSGNAVTVNKDNWSATNFSGTVYCAATETGFFLVRRDGVIHVTGNSGRNFQPQNLPARGLPPQRSVDLYIRALKADMHEELFDDLMTYGSAALRGVVVAPDNQELAVADLSNIEGRVNAWLAGEKWKLEAFFEYDAGTGPDLYNVTAGSILGQGPYDISKRDRNVFGKVPELALGYEGGYGALETFCKAYGVVMADHADTIRAGVDPKYLSSAKANYTKWGRERNPEADQNEWLLRETIKLAWRGRHPKIVQLWKSCKEAARLAIQNPGKTYAAGRWLKFKIQRHAGIPYLLCRLPSGNFLCYAEPKYSEEDGVLTYMGIDSTASGGMWGKWQRLYTYGGKIVENACQSLALDIMAANMPEIDRSGFPIILTVHDEIIAEITEDGTGDDLAAFMSKQPDWLPNFPLAAAGYSTYRYRKD
ncbi:MAG: hypothetical protein COA78_14330 [Blastopirellula sp.]|nr:MAG: hypothetical protein COA78_14330 [Blastopirellula sp.]